MSVKHDEGKIMAGLLSDFSRSLIAVAEVGTFGAKKYTRGGWRGVEDGKIRYHDAMWRHELAMQSSPLDNESGLLHAAHQAWNSLARLELILIEQEKRGVGTYRFTFRNGAISFPPLSAEPNKDD